MFELGKVSGSNGYHKIDRQLANRFDKLFFKVVPSG